MRNDEEHRPSPEALLRVARAEESQDERGKLKIFLGYAAGVGKTYAMLEAAQLRRQDGRDVVAAYVESHGRPETDRLLEGLDLIPKLRVDYQGIFLPEMDIDAVLARRPQIALVDELAHTNTPGARHEKRWQDVEELLSCGIDVYTTVNIQHFESLNDIVAQITGITVRETVPDRLLDLAFEIRLVDLPPEDLLERMREGKVYCGEMAGQAVEKFFKPGNLMALRELSLRRAASRVDDQVRAYMESRSIAGPWPVAERLLVCVSGSPYSERLIRTTRRLADELKAPWHTVYIETPDSDKHSRENRQHVWRDLRLAESLGAQVANITSTSVAQALVDYAIQNNVSKIVVGKPAKPRWREFLRQPLVDQIIRLSGTIDVHVVSISHDPEKSAGVKPPKRAAGRIDWSSYGKGVLLVALATFLCQLVRGYLAPTNLMMIYLLMVVLAATKLGRHPAVLTALLSVLSFDFFFTPPRFTLAVEDTEYIVTFVALFTVGVVISTLVSQARERADTIRDREVHTASLYYLSRDLSVASDIRGILDAMIKNIEESLGAKLVVLLPEGERLEIGGASSDIHLGIKERAVADWAFRNRAVAGRGTDTLVSSELLYLPLQTSGEVLGILGVKLKEESDYTSPLSRRLLQAFATQAALAVERVRLSKQAEQAEILEARESLERALLNSISHDLRTPLVSITGVLGALFEQEESMSRQARRELLDTARQEAARLNRFVGNLLDMTRLEAGALKVRLTPCDIQDLVGCALAAVDAYLGSREVKVQLPDDLPPVGMDLVLMTQVLVNLLDNAIKYSPADTPIELVAGVHDDAVTLEVSDRGHGVAEADLKRIFDKFYRVPVPEGAGGTGLGLSICRGIVEAHGGRIRAENRAGGGLRVMITLPVE